MERMAQAAVPSQRAMEDGVAFDPAEMVRRIAAGDRAAWGSLVDEYGGLIWAITRMFRLSDSDGADVSQTTWLRLLEHLDGLRDPARVGAWLATTARRECLRVCAQGKRVVLVGDEAELDRADVSQPEVDANLLAAERRAAVHRALDRLPERWRHLVGLLTADPPLSYEEISAMTGLPVGSIGPTRGRCLHKMREHVEA